MAELTLDQQKAIALASARARAADSDKSLGSQPSFSQSLMSSPVGRFAHDALLPIVEGPARLLSKIDPTGGMVGPMLDKGEKSYQDALAASRNTPGYAAARSQADAIQAGKGSGLTDQVIAPFVPSLAGATGGLFGGSMDAANASADAATDAMSAFKNDGPWHYGASTLANLAGGFLGAPGGGAPSIVNATAKQVVPTIADLNTAKSAAYATVDNSPMSIAKSSVNGMVQKLQAALDKRGYNETLLPKTAAAMADLKTAAKSDQSLQGMEMQRRIAGIAAGAPEKADRAAARVMQDHIDDFIQNITPADLTGPMDPAAIAALPQARELASRSFKAQTIQGLMDKAGISSSNFSASGLENSLRTQFRKLANNDRGMARFTQPEQDAIKQVATGGSPLSATNLLRQVGKLSPQGAIPMMLEGAAVMSAGPGALAVPAAGFGARMGATALQKAAAKRALDLVSVGPGAARPLANPPLQLPQLTNRSAIPLGLFGSSYQTQNQ